MYHNIIILYFCLSTDDETAAEMLSAPLSHRKDLVEGLDADAIVDYLTHHGVLDQDKVPKLGQYTEMKKYNLIINKDKTDYVKLKRDTD